MGEKYSRHILRSPEESESWARLVRGIELAPVVVGHSREHQRIGAATENAMLVSEHRDAKSLHLGFPGVDAVVVLVISGHEEKALPRAKPAQRCDALAQVFHIAVDQIP